MLTAVTAVMLPRHRVLVSVGNDVHLVDNLWLQVRAEGVIAVVVVMEVSVWDRNEAVAQTVRVAESVRVGEAEALGVCGEVDHGAFDVRFLVALALRVGADDVDVDIVAVLVDIITAVKGAITGITGILAIAVVAVVAGVFNRSGVVRALC